MSTGNSVIAEILFCIEICNATRSLRYTCHQPSQNCCENNRDIARNYYEEANADDVSPIIQVIIALENVTHKY